MSYFQRVRGSIDSGRSGRWVYSVAHRRESTGDQCCCSGGITPPLAILPTFNDARTTSWAEAPSHHNTASPFYAWEATCQGRGKLCTHRSMATAGGALRTKVFTATWPSFATDASAYDGARVGRRGGAGRQHNAPRCQVRDTYISCRIITMLQSYTGTYVYVRVPFDFCARLVEYLFS